MVSGGDVEQGLKVLILLFILLIIIAIAIWVFGIFQTINAFKEWLRGLLF